MDEAILIEIAARFRQLEDAVERADLYGTFCQRVNKPMANKAAAEEIREDLETHIDACRYDMERMAEEIRKARA